MPRYRIKATEIWYPWYEVVAENEQEAIDKFAEDDGIEEVVESTYDRIDDFYVAGIVGDGQAPYPE